MFHHCVFLCPCSYLERKEFLERADQRQFEKERDARLASASKR